MLVPARWACTSLYPSLIKRFRNSYRDSHSGARENALATVCVLMPCSPSNWVPPSFRFEYASRTLTIASVYGRSESSGLRIYMRHAHMNDGQATKPFHQLDDGRQLGAVRW